MNKNDITPQLFQKVSGPFQGMLVAIVSSFLGDVVHYILVLHFTISTDTVDFHASCLSSTIHTQNKTDVITFLT